MRTFFAAIAAMSMLPAVCLAQRMIAVDSSRALYQIDITTGAKTSIGTVSANAATTGALAFDCPTQTVYVSSTSNDSLYKLDVATGVATLVGPYDVATPAIVMHGLEIDSNTGVLYGASSHNGGLYTINRTTGAATLVGLTGLTSFTNLAYHAPSGIMYATNSSTDSFYSIDLSTGAATLIGALAGPTNPNGLAVHTNGTIYLVDNNTDTLYTINRTTGAATAIGSTGAGNLLGLAYLHTDCFNFGMLVGIDSVTSSITLIDKSTGVATAISTLSANAGVAGGLATDSDTGTVYLSSTSNQSLYTLDVGSGVATLVGPYGPGATFLHGLEYDNSTGILYGVSVAGDLYRVNKNTGGTTLVGPTGLGSFANLGYDSKRDILFATQFGTADLYTVNRVTGATTLVGALGVPNNPSALAFDLFNTRMFMIDNATDDLYTVNTSTGAATLIGPTGFSNIISLVYLNAGAHPNATNLGVIAGPAVTTVPTAVPAAQYVRWYRFSIPGDVSPASGFYLDIDTTTDGVLANLDTEIGLYRANGDFVASDDDDGAPIGLIGFSSLSFGDTAPVRDYSVTPGQVNGNGRDGPLAAGVYYLSVSCFNTVFGNNWNVETFSSFTGAFKLNFRTNVTAACSPADLCDGLGNPPGDGFITGTDADFFVLAYFQQTQAPDGHYYADLCDGVGNPGPDGFVTGTDADFFTIRYFQGC